MWRSTHQRVDRESPTDMVHAIENSLTAEDLGEDPDRWLVIGPNRAGNLLEVVVLVTADGVEMVIHAMSLRAIFRRLLES